MVHPVSPVKTSLPSTQMDASSVVAETAPSLRIKHIPLLSAQDVDRDLDLARVYLDKQRVLPVGVRQARTMTDRGVRGPAWITKTTLVGPPENNLNQVVEAAFKYLSRGNETYTPASVTDVQAEWVGYRAGAKASEPEPSHVASMLPQTKYDAMMDAVKSSATMLHLAGGGFL